METNEEKIEWLATTRVKAEKLVYKGLELKLLAAIGA